MISKVMAARQRMLRDVRSIAHLPLVERLTHAKARKVFFRLSASVVVMLSGAFVAHHKHDVAHAMAVSEIFVDTFGYFVHGAGTIPLLRYIEPAWELILGEV